MTHALTADQRAALDALTARQRAFVLAYIETGNQTEAARRAGYANPDPEGARQIGKARVRAAIEALRAPLEASKIASIEELRALWSRWAREGVIERTIDGKRIAAPLSEREMVKASELLAKSQGAFIERREISGPNGGPIGAAQIVIMTAEEREALARGDGGQGT